MNASLAQRRRTRTLQVGFLVVLAVCVAQLAYWLIDEMRYTSVVTTERLAHLERDAATGQVAAEETARILHAAARRRNRYLWEGAFFLAVLLAAMAVVYRAVREEADLRRRQEDFLAAVSHELKSPLASLRLSAETLALRDPPAERRHELVRRLLADVERLQRMISNVLDASRLSMPTERGTTELGTRERVLLATAAAATLLELEELIVEGHVTVHTDIAPDTAIIADAEAAHTVLRNVLHNALRAASPNGNITLRATCAAQVVRLDVQDDGVGFAPHEASRLFEKFYRIEGANRTEGTGLGLYIVSRLITRDGGSVSAESAGPGRGARFTLSWAAAGESTS